MDNVVSIRTRRPLREELDAIAREEAAAEAVETEFLTRAQISTLTVLSKLAEMVAAGQVRGLTIVGRQAETGEMLEYAGFLNDVASPKDLLGLAGALDLLKGQALAAAESLREEMAGA